MAESEGPSTSSAARMDLYNSLDFIRSSDKGMGSEKGDDIEGGREEGRKEEEIIRGGGANTKGLGVRMEAGT